MQLCTLNNLNSIKLTLNLELAWNPCSNCLRPNNVYQLLRSLKFFALLFHYFSNDSYAIKLGGGGTFLLREIKCNGNVTLFSQTTERGSILALDGPGGHVM